MLQLFFACLTYKPENNSNDHNYANHAKPHAGFKDARDSLATTKSNSHKD